MSEPRNEVWIPIDGTADDDAGAPPRRRMSLLSYLEAAVAIGTVFMAMWQLLEIDRRAVGFVLVWSAVPLLMLAARWLARTRVVTVFAAAYLVLLGIGMAIVKAPSAMPALSFEHPGNTQEAESFNQLDAVSRRAIAWSMGQNMIFLPAMLGYFVFLVPLRRRDPRDLSVGTCLLGLTVLWGMSAVCLIFLSVALFNRS